MKKWMKKASLLYSLLLFLALQMISCSNEPALSAPASPSVSQSDEKGTRDNTPVVRTPVAGGSLVYQCESASVDASHISDGYVMAEYHGSNEKVKLQIKGPDGITYSYNLQKGWETFPLTAGNGSYTIGVYENISGNKYSTALSCSIDVTISDEFGPYLYPNQYVNFSSTSLAVEKAADLAFSADSDIEVVENVYNYIISNFSYDYDKAKNVTSGYLPDIDKVYTEKKGICFDYAAIMASMLRTQNIPTRLEVGYVGEEYHAWISTYMEDIGWVNGIIEFNGSDWNLLDPTFAATSRSPISFITEDSKYLTKYVY